MTKVLMAVAMLLMPLAGLTWAQEDVKAAASCKYCGMDREKFGHSRMFIEYDDGSTVGLCSLHCAAVELATEIDKTPKAVLVSDMPTRKLVDAEKAVWVIGGSKPGVMTKRAKWAFADKAGAEAFVKENGGKVITFDQAIAAAYEDMYRDNQAIREKRKAAKAKAGSGHQH